MQRVKSLIGCLAVAAAFASAVFAQESSWEDISAPARPARLAAGSGDDADFGAALEAAAAAEGRSTTAAKTEEPAPTSAPAKEEFVPKNEITVTKNTDKPDGATGKKKDKKPKAGGSGERLGNTMGARLGVGRDIDLSLGFGIGLSDVNRIGVGINMGWGTADGYGFSTYEGFGFFDWNVNLSDDGALRWFVGPGVSFGVYGAEKDGWADVLSKDTTWKVPGNGSSVDTVYKVERYTKENTLSKGDNLFSIGLGARTGLEVDLSFIDPDHALSMLRSSSVSLDIRFLLYLFLTEEQKNYPAIMPSLGITYNYVFGGGKAKDKK